MRLVTIKECAKILSVSKDTVIRYINSGKLKTISLGTGNERNAPRIDLASFLKDSGIDPALYLSGDQTSDQADTSNEDSE